MESSLSAISPTTVISVVPVAFAAIFVGGVALLIILVVRASLRERERRVRLHAHAAQLGWHPIAGPVPDPVAEAARSRRTKLALGARQSGYDAWVVWHQWTESSGSDSNSSRTVDLTRYFLWLGPPYPDVKLVRRTSIGGYFKPVRGIGTGDMEFDKRFLIKPADRHDAVQMVTPEIRQAMLAGYFANWEISGGTLILAYGDVPRTENLQPRADGLTHLARMLAGNVGAAG
jgi:hypothetical protein